MKQPSRQNLSNWVYGAECFLADITDQQVMLGLENEPKLKQSKLGHEESIRMLHDLADALKMDWPIFVKMLAKGWSKRRKLKMERLEWYEPGEMQGPKVRKNQ